MKPRALKALTLGPGGRTAVLLMALACSHANASPTADTHDDAPQTPTTPLLHAAPTKQVLIEAYGDSTTLGISCSAGHCSPRPQNAVTYLQDALRSVYGERVSVVNLGVGGTMAWQLRDGTDRGHGVPWQQQLAASDAQIVTINYGINEVMRNQTPEQFYAAETALVKTALALGKEPVLQTSNPMPDGRLNARLAAMVAMTRRVAAEQHVPIVDQYAYISGLPDWQSMMSDGAHPKPELYRLKAGQDLRVVDPLVRRLLAGSS
ncbi:SGNH/GDSL hydrolase family protein [Paraburkholderia sp. BCC1885]|uniref:SGNH/GDSL hydrolase family protein n=1 Tax=Paraburkholderia sp. BCC1885 TaxID=2562669 RepID=UPI0021B22638|nr:SGNH/GDSL hydrolase family protein [Paraburkholderia sp. BCC1885]